MFVYNCCPDRTWCIFIFQPIRDTILWQRTSSLAIGFFCHSSLLSVFKLSCFSMWAAGSSFLMQAPYISSPVKMFWCTSLQYTIVDVGIRQSVKNCNWSYLQGLACTKIDEVAKTQMQCIKCDDVCYESCTTWQRMLQIQIQGLSIHATFSSIRMDDMASYGQQ